MIWILNRHLTIWDNPSHSRDCYISWSKLSYSFYLLGKINMWFNWGLKLTKFGIMSCVMWVTTLRSRTREGAVNNILFKCCEDCSSKMVYMHVPTRYERENLIRVSIWPCINGGKSVEFLVLVNACRIIVHVRVFVPIYVWKYLISNDSLSIFPKLVWNPRV